MATYCMWANKRCLHEKEEKPLYCCKCLADEVHYYREKIKAMEKHYEKENTINGRELGNIDDILTLLDYAAQLNADVTIKKEDVPVLLEALEPVVKERAEYWQRFYAKFKQLNVKKNDNN